LQYLKEAAEQRLKTGDIAGAARLLANALLKGLDSAYVVELVSENPGLKIMLEDSLTSR